MNSITTAGYLQMAKDALVIAGGPYSLTLSELEYILAAYDTGKLTADCRLAMAIESDMQLIIGAEDHNPTKLAQAAGRALICNAIGNINCNSLSDAVDAYEFMRLHA